MAATQTDARTLRILEKLIWTALDQGGAENEKNAAAAKVFALCRQKGIDAKGFFALFGGTFNYSDEPKGPPAFTQVRMPWGKFRGDKLETVAQEQLSYLEWLLDNADRMSPRLRAAVQSTLDFYSGG